MPETREQCVLTMSADLGTLIGKISCAHRLPGYNGRYGIREPCTYTRRASRIAVRDHREHAHRQAYRRPVGVRAGASGRGLHGLDTGTGQDRVERGSELLPR